MSTEPAFSHLKAWIVEEEGSFTVNIRMYCSSWEQARAWGEEIAPSMEIAGEMISGLAARYAIPAGPYHDQTGDEEDERRHAPLVGVALIAASTHQRFGVVNRLDCFNEQKKSLARPGQGFYPNVYRVHGCLGISARRVSASHSGNSGC